MKNTEQCSLSASKFVTCLPWPWIFFGFTLVSTAYFMNSGESFWLSYLRSLVFFNGGIQCLWAALGHLVFPLQTAQKIGWQSNGFQTEIGGVNIAFGITGVLSFLFLGWIVPVGLMLTIFYSSCIYAHIRERMNTGRKASLMCLNTGIVVVSIASALIVLMR